MSVIIFDSLYSLRRLGMGKFGGSLHEEVELPLRDKPNYVYVPRTSRISVEREEREVGPIDEVTAEVLHSAEANNRVFWRVADDLAASNLNIRPFRNMLSRIASLLGTQVPVYNPETHFAAFHDSHAMRQWFAEHNVPVKFAFR